MQQNKSWANRTKLVWCFGELEETHDQKFDGDDPVRHKAQLLPLLDGVTPWVTFGLLKIFQIINSDYSILKTKSSLRC